MPIDITQYQNITLLLPKLNQYLSGMLKNDWFEIDFWQRQNAITGHSHGRNVAWFIGHQDDEWVLRHYHRGGMIAKLMGDKYLFSTIERTRCYREIGLLELMYQQGLPVPKPIAARVIKQGLFYQADLLIEKIPHTEDLAQKLSHSEIPETDWRAVGAMIAKFHEAGIYHSDLNAHNILQDNHFNFWLIDFDKCEQRPVENGWQQANLERLHRSFLKEKSLHQDFNFSGKCWYYLIEGYQNFYHLTPDARH